MQLGVRWLSYIREGQDKGHLRRFWLTPITLLEGHIWDIIALSLSKLLNIMGVYTPIHIFLYLMLLVVTVVGKDDF